MYELERQSIVRTCRALSEDGSFLGTWGNVSMRCEDRLLMTPSKVDYATLAPGDIVVMDLEGNVVEAQEGRVPTSEREVHRKVYLTNEEACAVIHAHTRAAMGISTLPASFAEVPCLVEEMSQLIGGGIPLTRTYVPAERHEELGDAVAEVIHGKRAAIMRNHGPVAWGASMAEAILSMRVCEKACALYLSVAALAPQPIPEPFVKSEHYRFFHTYGRE